MDFITQIFGTHNVLEIIQAIGYNAWFYLGSFILVLSILVFVHEWGHYIIARACGVRVETFSIGFGKEIWGYTDKSGTRWKFSLIPLGGYVQMFGDTDPASAGKSDSVEDGEGEKREMTDDERKVAFFSKPVWQRAAVVFAGPAINYIFAIMILAGLYITYGQPVSPPTAAAVIAGSSAEEAGFKPHDIIVSIDGKSVDEFRDIQLEMLVALDQKKKFKVLRDNQLIDIYASPKRQKVEDDFGFKSSQGFLGLIGADQGILISRISAIDEIAFETPEEVLNAIQSKMGQTFTIKLKMGEEETGLIVNPQASMNEKLGTQEDINTEALYLANVPSRTFSSHTVMTATQTAIHESYVMTRSSIEALWQMATGVRSATELGGIVRIGAVAGERAQQGVVSLIILMAILSINLGFINLLPIPMLDGGHLLFYAAESVIGRPVPEQLQDYAFRAGFVFLIGIMAFANLNDIYQLLT